MPDASLRATGWHEAYTRAMLEHSMDVITILDASGTVLYESPSVERMLGRTAAERIGTNVFAAIHPDDLPHVREAFQSRLANPDAPLTTRFRLRNADGSWRVVESTGRNRLDDPAVRGVVVSSRDVTERAASERARQWQSVAMLAAMDGMAIIDEQGAFLSANPAHAAIYGYGSPPELRGRSWTILYDDAELRRLEVEVMPFLARNGSWRGEAIGRRRDGTRFPQELSLSRLPEGGTVCVVRDITERRRAEEERERLVSLLDSTLESTADGLVVVDDSDRVTHFNRRFAEMWGIGGELVAGRSVDALIEDALHLLVDPAAVRARIAELTAVPDAESFDLLSLKDGRTLERYSRPLRVEGEVRGRVWSFRDVTARVAAEERLRWQQSLLADAQRMGKMGSWEHDLATGLGTWSEEGFRIFGRNPADGPITAEEFRELVHPDDRAWLDENSAAAFASGKQHDGEFRYLHASGEYRYVWSSVRIERDAAGVPRRMVGHLQDITERKRAEIEIVRAKEAAEAANRSKSEFLSSMSHELRTPLNSVIGFAAVLRKNREGRLDEQQLGYLERIHANGKHLLGLINDVLDLSKIEAGKMEVERTPVDLGGLVTETLAELGGAVRGNPVELVSKVPVDLPPFDTDPARLKQVLINLVGNAVKFTETGTITLTVVADPRTGVPLRLEVSDTGVGIPPEQLETIFRAFEQGESGIARRYGGTGLGLTISNAYCALMGHRLQVASEPGRGSTFSIVLGGADGEETSPEADEAIYPCACAESERPGTPLVLVIDDEPDARTLLTHHLQDLGCRTATAISGARGIRMARELRPDLITLDLLLPGMTGWEILRALAADPELRDIPVVVVSVVAAENRGTVLPAVDLIEKPIEREQLQDVLDRHIAPGTGSVLVAGAEAEVGGRLTGSLRALPRAAA